MPPVYGPTLVNGDEDVEPAAIVRVDYALSREQLVTALGLGFAQIAPDRDPAGLAVDEIRAEVEGFLAAAGIIETDEIIERDRYRQFPPQQQAVMQLLAAAVDRAYPPALPALELAPPSPDGTVTVRTRDAGPVTVTEPEWCNGIHRHGEFRADFHHASAQREDEFETSMGPAVVTTGLRENPFSDDEGARVVLVVEVSAAWDPTSAAQVEEAAGALERAAAHIRALQPQLAAAQDGGES